MVKWNEGLSNRVSIIIKRSYEVRYLYGCFVYHILSYSFGPILYLCIYGCKFCMRLFNFVNYVFLLLCYVSLLLCLCILVVTYVPFRVFCFIMLLFCVLFVCKCVLYYCHRVSTEPPLTNMSYLSDTRNLKFSPSRNIFTSYHKTTLSAQFVGTFITYLRTTFHIPIHK